MAPDFSKKTIETLAKRAGYLCSNPDCCVSTVGPNEVAMGATVIGEAAHIYAARAGQARFDRSMSDQARSEITNGIWLCRNCHKRVDQDEHRYSAELLFAWRESQEQHAAALLGTATERLRQEVDDEVLDHFRGYPPIIRRIVRDKPDGWEWRLTGELMRHLNKPHFRELQDLRDGVRALELEFIDEDQAMIWINQRLGEMQEAVQPVTGVLARINKAWGEVGEPGDVDEIHHSAKLLSCALERIVRFEGRLRAARIEPEYHEALDLLKDRLGSQIDKFAALPDRLDHFVSLAIERAAKGDTNDPLVITETIVFDLPKNWADDFDRSLQRIEQRYMANEFAGGATNQTDFGCLFWISVAVIILIIALAF